MLMPDVRLCLWQLTETLADLPDPVSVDLGGMRSESHRREVKAVYALLAHMTGRSDLVIGHEPTGRPVLAGRQIGISHTRGWAALIMSERRQVAVDIEYRSDRVGRVARRFIRPDEPSHTVSHQLINWSAKETVYKLRSDERLAYFDMRLHHFTPLERGELTVDDLKMGQKVQVSYELNDDFVLTWSAE